MNNSALDHEEVILLIPWYVNGSLDPEQHQLVAWHIARCHKCAEEVSLMERIDSDWERLQPSFQAKGDFSRLLESVLADEAKEKASAPDFEISDRAGKRTGPTLVKRMGNLLASWSDFLVSTQGLAASGIGFASILLLLNIVPMKGLELSANHGEDYHTLATRGSMSRFNDKDLVVVFSEEATAAQIKEIVNSINGSIADGPSDTGAYTVRLQDTTSMLGGALKKLRGHNLVMLAEPALPPTPK